MATAFRHLTREDRIRMETLLRAGHSKEEVAEILSVHRSTVYREYNRGKYMHRTYEYMMEERYSSDLAQQRHEWNGQLKGKALKLGSDKKLADFIEYKIGKEKYSPEAVLGEIKEKEMEFEVSISVRTLYRYIDKGIFLNLTNKDLPVKGKKKTKQKKIRERKKPSFGESIEKRPEEVMLREEVGHWEMDTVKGKRGVTRSCLLVLTERMTREEIIMKLPDGRTESVVQALDLLEKKTGNLFTDIFKTITVDNGSEFADEENMKRSCRGIGKERTKIFYCHPYSSWERGTNENQNRLIRRHYPKGTDFDKVTNEEVKHLETWINHYPRRMFEYKSSEEIYQEEIRKII